MPIRLGSIKFNRIEIAVLGIFLSVLLYNFFQLDGFHSWGDDFSSYLSQSKVIHDGEYSKLDNCVNLRIKYSEFQVGPNYYPWFYPLSLSFGFFIDLVDILAIKQFSYIYSIFFYFALFLIFVKRLRFLLTLSLMIVFATHPFFIESNQHILSDIYASGILLIALYVLQRAYEQRSLARKISCFALFSVVSFIAVNIRTSSNIIYLVAIGYAFIKYISDKKHSNFIFAITSFLLSYCFVTMFNSQFPSSNYLENHELITMDFLNHFVENLVYYFQLIIDFFFPFPLYAKTFFGLVFCYIFYRKRRIVWLHLSLAEKIFIFFYFGLFLFYPYQQGIRFIIPLLPFCLFILFVRFKVGINRYEKFFFSLYISLFLTFNAIRYLDNTDLDRSQLNPSFANSAYAEEAYDFIQRNTFVTESIVFFKPRALTYFTDRCSVWIESPEFLSRRDSYFLFFKGKEYSKQMTDFLVQKRQVFENKYFILYSL
ncbi:MAG: hypothetical protein O9301_12315 [Leptospira sp.]|nr:hypothetical protein [Leptospira sp.]